MAILETWFGLMLLVLFNGLVCLVLPRLLSLNWGAMVSISTVKDFSEPQVQSTKAEVEEGVASISAGHS